MVRPQAVLVIARPPRGSRGLSDGTGGLESLLGGERLVALLSELIIRAVQWASDVAPGAVHVSCELGEGDERGEVEAELLALAGRDVRVFSTSGAGATERIANASAQALDGSDGPLIIAWPDLPRWHREIADAALDDLDNGCGFSVGPVFDGGFYLVAMARPIDALFSLPDDVWRSPDALSIALGAAFEAGIDAGLLRPERGLHSAADARAALADPLLDSELRHLLDCTR